MSVFDGMAGVINRAIGAPVTHVAQATGVSTDLQGILREAPYDLTDQDGREVRVLVSTLRLTAQDAAAIFRGDTIRTADARVFRVSNRQPGGSPASDAFVIFELEDVTDG